MELVLRFYYGSAVPWVRKLDGGLHAIAGPEAVELRTPVSIRGRGLTSVAAFEVWGGQRVPFVLTWHPSHQPPPEPVDVGRAVDDTTAWWQAWSGQCSTEGEHRQLVSGP